MYLFNDSPCVDYLKLKFYDVVVTVNSDFYVFGLTVVCFHYSYSLFYLNFYFIDQKKNIPCFI